MDFETTAIKPVTSHENAMRKLRASYGNINKLPTYKIVWYVLRKHEVGLLRGALVLIGLQYIGALQVLLGLVQSLFSK